MMRAERGPGYSRVAMLLHWGIAAAILGQMALGLYMVRLPAGSMSQFENFQLHKSIGITILLLTGVRILWRLGHRPPPLPAQMPRWERAAATASHHLLYLFMVVLPLTGWAIVSASPLNLPTMLYGRVPWPHIPGLQQVADRRAVAEGFSEAHEILAVLMLGLVALHVAAALRHHLLLKDDILMRMVPFGKREGDR